MDMSDNSSSNASVHFVLTNCLESRTTFFIFTSILFTYLLVLLPLLLFILFLGLQQWRQHRSTSASSLMSHSDFFTYNMAALDLINILGVSLYCLGVYMGVLVLISIGNFIFYLTTPGETLFHILTCVERYLAVVHPITYLSLKKKGGVKIRNITCGCIWLLCFGLLCLFTLCYILLIITCFCIMGLSLIVTVFCSFSVLHVLKHPGPGEVSQDRKRVDQSKQRAFHTIVAITVAQFLRFVGVLVCTVTFSTPVLTYTQCTVGSAATWLNVPCTLVLPLLYLQRAGKLPGFKHKTDSG